MVDVIGRLLGGEGDLNIECLSRLKSSNLVPVFHFYPQLHPEATEPVSHLLY